MRFASLGSGSKGNGTVIDDGETRILIDLGFTIKASVQRLARLNLTPGDIDALLVTHEHADHIHGVAGFARKFRKPVFLTHGTYQAEKLGALPELHLINSHTSFNVGSFEVRPVAVPHDAREPCQFLVNAGSRTVGVLTDLGHITPHVIDSYRECDALLLECNHDLEMLAQGPYPFPLKQRVGGNYGHLNNGQAAELVASVNLDRLQQLVVSHVSEQNNLPSLACDALTPLLAGWQGALSVAGQYEGFDWIEL